MSDILAEDVKDWSLHYEMIPLDTIIRSLHRRCLFFDHPISINLAINDSILVTDLIDREEELERKLRANYDPSS